MTKSQAREKIRNHLDTRSKHSVTVTERMSRYWWTVVNVALFDDKLYPPRQFLIEKLKDWGYCRPHSNGDVTIGLDEEIPNREMFLATLVHEMVHQWEHKTYGRMGHGVRYKKWVEGVTKTLGLDIHSDYDTEEYTYGEELYKRRQITT